MGDFFNHFEFPLTSYFNELEMDSNDNHKKKSEVIDLITLI